MKALRFYGVEDLRYEDVDNPKIENDTDVIIKVKAVGICGSDLSRFRKVGPHNSGNILGHEFSGEVVEVGSKVKDLKVGDRVTVNPAIVCGECEYCLGGRYSKCNTLSVLGAIHQGAFSEYIRVQSVNVIKIVDSMSFEEGALIEPSATVIHGLYNTSMQMGYEVAVVGCGSIGLLAIQWLKLFGAKKIFAIDINENKLKMAKEMGADVIINSTNKKLHDVIMEYGNGVDLAIESAGNPITAEQVLGLPKKGGEVLYLGIPYGDVNFSRFHFERILRSELKIVGSWNCISAPLPGREWMNAIDFINSKKVDVSKIVTHKVSLSEGPDIFKKIVSNPNQYGKVMLYP